MDKPMTKSELVSALAEKMGSDKRTAATALDSLVELLTEEVAAGKPVAIPGIGKFFAKDRLEREVRNPATGEMMTKAADKQAKVTLAKAFKDAVNN